MNYLKQFALIFIAVSATLFSSCRKDVFELTRQEQRLVGTWIVTKEVYRKSIWVKNAEQQMFLLDGTLEIKPDRSARFVYANEERELNGSWELECNVASNGDGTTTTQSLILALHEAESNATSSVTLENFGFTQRRIRSFTQEREGSYRHVMERQ